MKKAIVTLAIALASASQAASFATGDDILRLLIGTPQQQSQAAGYIIGATDVFNGLMFCLPEEATPDMVIGIVGTALALDPQLGKYPADQVIYNVFKDTFQCPQKGVGV